MKIFSSRRQHWLFAADCVKNPCRAKARLRSLSLTGLISSVGFFISHTTKKDCCDRNSPFDFYSAFAFTRSDVVSVVHLPLTYALTP